MENKKYIYGVQYRIISPYTNISTSFFYVYQTNEKIFSNDCVYKVEEEIEKGVANGETVSVTSINLL